MQTEDKKLTIDNHKHEYISNPGLASDECIHCGLLKSTIEKTEDKSMQGEELIRRNLQEGSDMKMNETENLGVQ